MPGSVQDQPVVPHVISKDVPDIQAPRYIWDQLQLLQLLPLQVRSHWPVRYKAGILPDQTVKQLFGAEPRSKAGREYVLDLLE